MNAYLLDARPDLEFAGEHSRSKLMLLGFFIFLGVENPIRKWLLPGLSAEIYVFKFVFLAAVYLVIVFDRLWPSRNGVLLLYYVLFLAAILVFYVQMLCNYNFDIRYFYFGIYGLANNFLFFPLAFVTPILLTRRDVVRICGYVTWFAIISAPVIVLQFYAPATAPINAGFGSGAEAEFTPLAGGLEFVRPEGMFTNAVSQALMVALAFSIILYSVIQGEKIVSRGVMLAGMLAVFVMVLFGSNRTEASEIAVTFLMALFVMMRRPRRRDFVFLILLLIVSVCIVGVIVFVAPESGQAFVDRWTAATGSDARSFQGGFFGRSLYPIYAFVQYIPVTPIFGYLVGICNDSVSSSTWFQMPSAAKDWHGYGIWGREGGFAVHIVELGPIVGTGYILLRFYAVLWTFRRCLGSLSFDDHILPLMLFSVGGLGVLYLPIVTNGDVGAACWAILGLALAACHESDDDAAGGDA